jgi:hypothetical protein
MFVSCVCCVGSDLCDVLITRSEEFYRVCVCVCVCVSKCDLETSKEAPRPQYGCCVRQKKGICVHTSSCVIHHKNP